MKISLLFVLLAVSFTAAREVPSDESIKDFLVKLKNMGILISQELIAKNSLLVDDVVRVKATPEVYKEILKQQGPTSEGILSNVVGWVWNAATGLLKGATSAPGDQSLVSIYEEFPVHTLMRVQQNLSSVFFKNNTDPAVPDPNDESVIGILTKLGLNGIGNLVGGTIGNVLNTAGGIFGNLLFVKHDVSQTTKPDLPTSEGIFSGIMNVIKKGATQVGKEVAGHVIGQIGNAVGSILLNRGSYSKYSSIEDPVNEIYNLELAFIENYQPLLSEQVLSEAKYNLSVARNKYSKRVGFCQNSAEHAVKPLLVDVGKFIDKAMDEFHGLNREAAHCIENSNKDDCLNKMLKPNLNNLYKTIASYGRQMGSVSVLIDHHGGAFDTCIGSKVREFGTDCQEIHEFLSQHLPGNTQ